MLTGSSIEIWWSWPWGRGTNCKKRIKATYRGEDRMCKDEGHGQGKEIDRWMDNKETKQ